MLKVIIAKAVAKHGLIPLLIKVGDFAVKATKTKKDVINYYYYNAFIKRK